jgi:ribose-phosphate pyrophosphokinase
MSDLARIVAGTGNRPLAVAIAEALGTEVTPCEIERFPDGELRPSVGEVRGGDVYVVQPTGPAVDEHLVELMLLLDACRRAGADRVTAVVAYFGYARQDRRGRTGQAVGARVAADALATAGADRLVVVDPHTAALEAMSDVPVEALTAVPALATTLGSVASDATVVVAPDLGAVKLAERYAAAMGRLPVAVVRKARLSGSEVEAHDLVGDVDGRPVVIVDDMISTGATIEAAIGLVRDRGGTDDVTVAATHGLLVADAAARMAAAGARRIVVTDTLPVAAAAPVEVCTVAPLLADAIRRLHADEPLATPVGR